MNKKELLERNIRQFTNQNLLKPTESDIAIPLENDVLNSVTTICIIMIMYCDKRRGQKL